MQYWRHLILYFSSMFYRFICLNYFILVYARTFSHAPAPWVPKFTLKKPSLLGLSTGLVYLCTKSHQNRFSVIGVTNEFTFGFIILSYTHYKFIAIHTRLWFCWAFVPGQRVRHCLSLNPFGLWGLLFFGHVNIKHGNSFSHFFCIFHTFFELNLLTSVTG